MAVMLCAAALAGCQRVSEEPVGGSVIAPGADAYKKDFVSPVYSALTEEEKQLYDKIRSSVEGFEDIVEFDEPVPRETVRKIYKLVYAQERKYFWLSNIFYAPDTELTVLRLSYLYAKEDAALKRAELDISASEIVGEISESASDFEKAVYFHDRIAAGCEFSKTSEHVNSAYGVLVAGAGQCEGYAAAMSLLCDKANIPNYIVCGTNDEGSSHAWNKILLNGEWYNADCTWDDPILKRDNPDFVRHDYLFVTDEEIEGKTHFTDELYADLPACTATEMNYFAKKGLLFDTAAEAAEEIKEQIRAAGISGKREAELRLTNSDAYYASLARLFDSGEIKKIIEDVNGEYGTRIRSAYMHNNDNLNIVHVSLIYEGEDYRRAEDQR